MAFLDFQVLVDTFWNTISIWHYLIYIIIIHPCFKCLQNGFLLSSFLLEIGGSSTTSCLLLSCLLKNPHQCQFSPWWVENHLHNHLWSSWWISPCFRAFLTQSTGSVLSQSWADFLARSPWHYYEVINQCAILLPVTPLFEMPTAWPTTKLLISKCQQHGK